MGTASHKHEVVDAGFDLSSDPRVLVRMKYINTCKVLGTGPETEPALSKC